jgi:hypothetical protein
VRIIPLPFMNYEQVATVYRASDALMLSGIAPATLYELIEARAGTPIVQRINPGPERYNLDYVQSRQLGLYEPETDDFIRLLGRLSHSPHLLEEYNDDFRAAAERERIAALRRTGEMARFIERVAFTETHRQEHIPTLIVPRRITEVQKSRPVRNPLLTAFWLPKLALRRAQKR